jgi:hypothetical protein
MTGAPTKPTLTIASPEDLLTVDGFRDFMERLKGRPIEDAELPEIEHAVAELRAEWERPEA